MIRSMTGYGRAQEVRNGREITVEMRAVNNRFLDLTIKLPRVYSFAEDALKQLVKAAVARGKVDVYITVNDTGTQSVSVSLNRPVLEGYLQALRTMAADYGVTDDLTVSTLSRIPDVFRVEKPEEDEQQLIADLSAVMEQALHAACRTPLEILRVTGQALELIEQYAAKGSALAISDAGVAAALCRGAMQGAALNVYINTRAMADRTHAAACERETDALLAQYIPLADRVYEQVTARLRK